MSHSVAISTTPRYRTIYVPILHRSFVSLFLLSIALIVSYAMTVVIMANVWAAIMTICTGEPDPPPWLVASTVWLAFVGPVLCAIVLHVLRHALLMRHTRLRSQRLVRITGIQGAIARVPHRFVERALRSPFGAYRKARRVLGQAPIGTCIMVQPMSRPHGTGICSRSIPFEPVPVGFDTDEGLALVSLCRSEGEQISSTSSNKRAILKVRRQPSWMLRLVIILGTVTWLGWTSFRLVGPIWAVLCVMVAIAPAGILMFRKRQLWIVPGGLALREVALWRKTPRIRLFARTKASMFADLRGRPGCVADAYVAAPIRATQRCALAVVAGWISTARTPTLEEVRTLLDPESDEAGRASEAPPTKRAN